jgi:protease I
MAALDGFRVAILATDGFEEAELTDPLRALREAGARVEVIAPHGGKIQGFKHHDKSLQVDVDRTLDEVRPDDFQGLVLPGGALNADALRVEKKAQEFVRRFFEAGRPVGAICHAPWILVSAGVAKGRSLTSYHTIADDLRNAGARWEDREVIVDGNLVTSRKPADLPAFDRSVIELFERAKRGALAPKGEARREPAERGAEMPRGTA